MPSYSGAMSGCTIDAVPSAARVSLHDSSKCSSGTCQWQRADVSSSYWLKWTASGTFVECGGETEIGRRIVNRIAAQDYERLHLAGFASRRPVAAANRRAAPAGPAIGSRYSTVAPTLPSVALIQCASAWTTGGWPRPAITRLRPRAAANRRDCMPANPAEFRLPQPWHSRPCRFGQS